MFLNRLRLLLLFHYLQFQILMPYRLLHLGRILKCLRRLNQLQLYMLSQKKRQKLIRYLHMLLWF